MSRTPTERPILFSGPMIRAIMMTGAWAWPGRPKTQTRRLLQHDGPKGVRLDNRGFEPTESTGLWIGCNAAGTTVFARCPYGVVGDRLWVRERLVRLDEGPVGEQWCYAADGVAVQLERDDPRVPAMVSWAHHKEGDNCVSIHMPRWASRLTLEVTGVRAERLQNISEEDARAEGAPDTTGQAEEFGTDQRRSLRNWFNLTRRQRFARLWDTINGERADWTSNPWVWVISFKRIEVDHAAQ